MCVYSEHCVACFDCSRTLHKLYRLQKVMFTQALCHEWKYTTILYKPGLSALIIGFCESSWSVMVEKTLPTKYLLRPNTWSKTLPTVFFKQVHKHECMWFQVTLNGIITAHSQHNSTQKKNWCAVSVKLVYQNSTERVILFFQLTKWVNFSTCVLKRHVYYHATELVSTRLC